MDNCSLLQCFDPPEGYVGQTCICCALSADQDFMQDAMGRFTKHRLFDGAASIYLMLDKTGTLLDTQTIKGLVQYQAKFDEKIYIQHAKVALMQFGSNRKALGLEFSSDIIWRIVVSTGNWTKASACNNIEIVWKADLCVNDISNVDEQLFSDVLSVADFFKKLSTHYVISLPGKGAGLWKRAAQMFACIESFRNSFKTPKLPESRFISSVEGLPLMKSIETRFKDGVTRNFIQIGSGFYEQDTNKDKPEIIKRLDCFLKECPGFTKRCRWKRIVVNRKSAGQLKSWDAKNRDGWRLYDIKDPIKIKDEKLQRDFLHAKYICLANHSNDKNREGVFCNSKFYIGSGNLSIKGLMSAYGVGYDNHPGAGNIEAGIVVDVPDSSIVTSLLSRSRQELRNSDLQDVEIENEDENISKVPIPICPINSFRKVGGELEPQWNSRDLLEDLDKKCIVFTETDALNIDLFSKKKIGYPKDDTVSLCVRWGEQDYWIPVLESNGNLTPAKIMVNGFEQLLTVLAEFPDLEEDDPEGGDERRFVRHLGSGFKQEEVNCALPIQTAMKFVEGIARYNEKINDLSIDDWIDTLERSMANLPTTEIDKLMKMKVNFLNVLTVEGFAPELKKNKIRWSNFVNRISEKWGMKEFASLKR